MYGVIHVTLSKHNLTMLVRFEFHWHMKYFSSHRQYVCSRWKSFNFALVKRFNLCSFQVVVLVTEKGLVAVWCEVPPLLKIINSDGKIYVHVNERNDWVEVERAQDEIETMKPNHANVHEHNNALGNDWKQCYVTQCIGRVIKSCLHVANSGTTFHLLWIIEVFFCVKIGGIHWFIPSYLLDSSTSILFSMLCITFIFKCNFYAYNFTR